MNVRTGNLVHRSLGANVGPSTFQWREYCVVSNI